jgi:hypothetical protein
VDLWPSEASLKSLHVTSTASDVPFKDIFHELDKSSSKVVSDTTSFYMLCIACCARCSFQGRETREDSKLSVFYTPLASPHRGEARVIKS